MTLYTRTGDAGETALVGGARVRKDHQRVEACGEVDELNGWLGLVRAAGLDPDLRVEVERLQQDVLALGARLADPAARMTDRATKTSLGDDDVARLERLIDRLEAETGPLDHFVLPGGSQAGAALHVARSVCRRAERRIVALEPPLAPVLLRYVNRLSDLLFALARAANHRARVTEIEW